MIDTSSTVRSAMVTTRRSGANAASTPYAPLGPSNRRKKASISDTSDQRRKLRSMKTLKSRTPSTPTGSMDESRLRGELNGLAPTSPSNGRLPVGSAVTKVYQPVQAEAKFSTENILAALKKLITPGTSQNPIILLEDSALKGTQEALESPNRVEPHVFQNRNGTLYTYTALRCALASRPANGSTFAGHPGHDMFCMRAAKMATADWHASVPQQDRQDLPFATRHLASQPVGPQYASARSSVPYFSHTPPAYPQSMIRKPLNEENLRSKALQCVREYSRSSVRKRKIADDPDETSESDSTEIDMVVGPPPHELRFLPVGGSHARFKNGPVTILPDPHFQLTPLIEQASLLTSLLRVYPQ